MVGGAVGLACAALGYRVVIIDPYQIKPFSNDDPPDLRVSALNMHSIQLLKSLGVWQKILAMRATPYSALSCWENEQCKTEFKAGDVGAEQLGYFVENRVLQLALWDKCSDLDNIDLVVGNSPEKIDTAEARITLSDDTDIHADIIIAADGANSQARSAANIGCTGWNYTQCANLFTVKMTDKFEAETWQQFTPSGPMAFLPMHETYACLVWYTDQKYSDELMSVNDQQTMTSIKAAFPNRLGDFELMDKARFNLTRQHANRYAADKLVLLGDAAHTINPLAGQGVNLGFKDVSAFVDGLERYKLSDFNGAFSHYEKGRRTQNLLMMSAMDAIYATFSNRVLPLQLLRNFALKLADSSGPIKHQVLKYAMGLSEQELM